MVIPSFTTLPLSGLSPEQVRAKFQSTSLAGLGCGCSEVDEDGICLDPDPCSSSSDSSSTDLSSYLNTIGAGSTSTGSNTTDLSGYLSSIGVSASTTGNITTYTDSNGNVIMTSPSGGYLSVSPTGSVSQGSGSPPAKGSGSGLTTAQAQVYSSLINQASQIAKLAVIQPGTTILPNGTVMSTTLGSGIGTALTSLAGNSGMFLLLGGLLLVVAMSGNKQ